MPQYVSEVRTCLRCGSPVDVVVEEQYSAQGHLIGRPIHRFKCRGGCMGRGVLTPLQPGQGGGDHE